MVNDKGTFRIAVRKFDAFEAAMQQFWDKYCINSGCTLTLEMVIMDLPELHEATLINKGLAKGDFDIAHINTDWIVEGSRAGAFEELNAYIQQQPPVDFPDAWSKSLLTLQQIEGKILGLPFHDGPECLIYRKDLFENELEKKMFQEYHGIPLTVPRTWEEFHQVAQFFNRPADNLYGSVFACFPDGHNAVFDFCLQLWNRGGSLLNEEGNIAIDSMAAIEGLTYYRKLLKDLNAVHPKSPGYDSVEAGLAFARGEAAMMINWFGFAAMCDTDQASPVKGKVGVTLVPASQGYHSASLNVYWLYTIGSGSKHKQIAYDFIRFATSAENDKLLTLAGGIGCRISSWRDEEVNAVIPYFHELEQLHLHAKTLPQLHNWPAIAAIIDNTVTKALTTTIPAVLLLQEAQEQIKTINL
ncbi:ABC transporter substrate-binding protein [Pedobacter sp.]|uniref:ABC transporter substrate-binding protein n=1 Tax=Pedobacter sp. TaxID=1411316 RepID=UPI003D7FBE14